MKIVLQHLTKKFPARGPVRGRKNREDVIAVNDFDFEIPDGKLIGLLGPSGCGKSTALNLICGLLKPTDGKIFSAKMMSPDFRPRTAVSAWCSRTMPSTPTSLWKKTFSSPRESEGC